jgi:hypothetical protein
MERQKAQRLAMYRRTLKALETFVANKYGYETRININVNQHKSYHFYMNRNLGLCFVMKRCGFIDSYIADQYIDTAPELYRVAQKHKCVLEIAGWFRFEGKPYLLSRDVTKAYQKRIEFMKEVIEETLKS